MTNITAELQATRLLSLQNRMVLDVILADRGGACRIIGSSCCVYIPDTAPTVYAAIQKLHKIASDIHQDNGSWSWTDWLWSIFGSWGWKTVSIVIGIAVIILTCCLCINCLSACCSLCTSYCVSKFTSTPSIADNVPHTRAMLLQPIEDIMNIDEGIFEY